MTGKCNADKLNPVQYFLISSRFHLQRACRYAEIKSAFMHMTDKIMINDWNESVAAFNICVTIVLISTFSISESRSFGFCCGWMMPGAIITLFGYKIRQGSNIDLVSD